MAHGKTSDISRRDFLAGIATASVAAAGAGLVGCGSSSSSSSSSSTSSSSTKSGSALTAETAATTKWSFEEAPDPIDESKISDTITNDVIVIGCGMSGMATALSAKESGVDVRIVSAGTSATSRGGSNNGIGTKYQKAHGVDYTPENCRQYVQFMQLTGSYRVDKRKWSRWIENSAESIEWMMGKAEKQGYSISLELPYDDPDNMLYVPSSAHNLYNADNPAGPVTGAGLQATMYLQELSTAGVEIDFNTRALYLIRENDNKGRVSGFVAQKLDTGEYVKYAAKKAVVMATGDFSKNKDMMACHAKWLYDNFKDDIEWDTDDGASLNWTIGAEKKGLFPGDGQKMGLWIGAAWQKNDQCPGQMDSSENGPVRNGVGNFAGINLASDGKRFMNENTNFYYGANAIMSLPDRTVYCIWDNAYADTMSAWPLFPEVVGQENGIMPLTPDEERGTWDKSVDGSTYVKADTIDELLAQLDGLDVSEAKKSIERYNTYAAQGYDEEFQVNPSLLFPVKTAPFYAKKRVGGEFLTVCGGLRTDENLQVCEEDDTPIEGLYNVGTMTGDMFASDYNFVMAGINLGACCCTFPYLLGKQLAEL